MFDHTRSCTEWRYQLHQLWRLSICMQRTRLQAGFHVNIKGEISFVDCIFCFSTFHWLSSKIKMNLLIVVEIDMQKIILNWIILANFNRMIHPIKSCDGIQENHSFAKHFISSNNFLFNSIITFLDKIKSYKMFIIIRISWLILKIVQSNSEIIKRT